MPNGMRDGSSGAGVDAVPHADQLMPAARALAEGDERAGDAAERWLAIHDELLRGLTHSLSNRIATVSAASYMFEHGDVAAGQAAETLRNEADRLDAILQMIRLLPQRPNAAAEPVSPGDAATTAAALHAHHCDHRDVPCDVECSPAVYPVWVEPAGFGHALLVAITAAKRAAGATGRVVVRVSGDADVVHFLAIPAAGRDVGGGEGDSGALQVDPLDLLDAAAANRLLSPFGGRAHPRAGGCLLEVPTLLAARRNRKRAD